MTNATKIHVSKRVVLGRCVSVLLTIASVAQSQTAAPDAQPTPGTESSPAVSATPAVPRGDEKAPALVSPTLPPDSAPQPALPMASPGPGQPSEAPESPLVPPVAGPGALPTATPRSTLPPQTVQALDQEFQESLRIRRVHPKELLFISLMDAVRLALYQNSDVRLAVQDSQLAKGALVKAAGDFDAKILAVIGYAKSFLSLIRWGSGTGLVP